MTSLPQVPLRLAAVQATQHSGDPVAAIRAAADIVVRVGNLGARLVVFPELQTCAYDLTVLARHVGDRSLTAGEADEMSDPRLDVLAAAARDLALTVVIGAAVRHPDGRLTNSLLVLDGNGARVAYDKQHLWHDDEAQLFDAGRRGGAITVHGWHLGLSVCYDMSFPEHARASALSGAHAYLCPSAFAAGREHRAAIYMAARALENTMYAVFVNPVGGPPDRPCRGGTALYGPDGVAVAHAGGESEKIVIADLDPDRIMQTRSFLHMLAEVGAVS